MATRQAINVGFPTPSFVSETDTRQAILPGAFLNETVVNTVELTGQITTSAAAKPTFAPECRLLARARTAATAQISATREARLSAKATTAAEARATPAPEAHISATATAAAAERGALAPLAPISARASTSVAARSSLTKQNLLSGRLQTASEARLAPPILALELAGRISAESAAALDLPLLAAPLRGRIAAAAYARTTITARDLRVDAARRETLLADAQPSVLVSGEAREALLADAQPSVRVGDALRETLLSTDDTSTTIVVAAAAREVLISTDDASADTTALIAASARETLLSTDDTNTELRVAGLVRETLLFSTEGMLAGRITASSRPRGTLLATVPVSGRITTGSRVTPPLSLVYGLSGRIATQARAGVGGVGAPGRPFEGIPAERELSDADPLWVAVEIDLWDNTTQAISTLLISNRGPLTRTIDGALRQYEPRLMVPLVLGSTLTVFSGGGTSDTQLFQSPLRGQPNGGAITFIIDPDFANWINVARYSYLGRTFRVYEGRTASDVLVDVDEDAFDLVYTGHIAGFSYDLSGSSGPVGSFATTDASSTLDRALVTDFYPADFAIETLRGKPRPQLWGRKIDIQPVLEDQANLIYRISRRPLAEVTDLRVGGVSWRQVAGPPNRGEYSVDLAAGTVTLGSVTEGAEVRCDAANEVYNGVFQVGGDAFFLPDAGPGIPRWDFMTTAALITTICDGAGVPVNPAYMAQLDIDWPGLVGYYATPDRPVNRLDAIDEITLANLCWWDLDVDASVIAGFVKLYTGDEPADLVLFASGPPIDLGLLPFAVDPIPKELGSLSLQQLIPPAWRVRTEYERHDPPETSFLGGATEEEQSHWRSPGLVADWDLINQGFIFGLSPTEGQTVLIADPRAQDIYLRTLAWRRDEADILRGHLIDNVVTTSTHEIYDSTAYLPAAQIKMFQKVAVLWVDENDRTRQTFTGYFRTTSAIRVLGGGPQQLELWGTATAIGAVRPADPWMATFTPITLLHLTPFTTNPSASAEQPGLNSIAGTAVAIIQAQTSNSSPFVGTYSFDAPFGDAGGLVRIQVVDPTHVYVVLTETLNQATLAAYGYLMPGDFFNVTVTASGAAGTETTSFAFAPIDPNTGLPVDYS